MPSSAATRYVQISNFKWGLDSRRSELLDQPGALVQCENAHINQGGEIEQRKSFAKQEGVASANTFGFETTATGIVRFGSALVGVVTLPTGMLYRRCDHPTGFKVGGAAAAMTGVLASTNFNGQAFVLTQFDDGNIFAYLGDVSPMPLVAQITRDGNVLYIASGPEGLSQLAVDLNTIFSSIEGFHPTPNVDETGLAVNGDVTLLTDPGVHLQFVPSIVSAAGIFTTKLIDQNQPTVANQVGTATFSLTSGTTGTAVLTVGALNISGTVNFTSDLHTTAQAITTAVNAHGTGYSAVCSGVNVTVSTPAGLGATANALTLTVTFTGTLGVGAGTTNFAAYVSFNGVVVSSIGMGASKTSTKTVSVVVTGLTGNATYAWALTNNTPPALTITPGGTSCTIVYNSAVTQGVLVGETALLTVTVTDGPTGDHVSATCNITVP